MNAIRTLSILVGLVLALPLFAESDPTDYRLDHEFFRRGLIDRGFDDWLKVYDQQHPPTTDIDLLAEQIGRAWLNYRRESDPQKRSQNLETLLLLESDRVESYPEHPLAANWRVRYAGDLLNEKIGPLAFIHLLNLSLPGNLNPPFQQGLDQIESQLGKARTFLQTRLAEFQRFDDNELAQANRQGLPELYQAALLQADYLHAWCLYHRAKLLPAGDPNRVKLLYELADLLKSFRADAGAGSENLLRASADRLLGNLAQGRAVLDRSLATLPGTYLPFARIEWALVALAEHQPRVALDAVEKIRSSKAYSHDPARRELLDLTLLWLEGRAKLELLSPEGRLRSQARNEIWTPLTAELAEKSRLQPFVFPQLLQVSDNCPLEGMADIELFAHAENAMNGDKMPLAQSALRALLDRETVLPALKIAAAMRLAKTLEQQGHFAQAVTILDTVERENPAASAEVLAETARLAWLTYQADRGETQRNAFIQSATRLLERFPNSEFADQFKLLMAEEFSQAGQFNQALQWIGQVPAGSPRYLQARTQRVLVLTRQYKAQTADAPRTQASPAERILADQVEKACDELFILVSAKQPDPADIKTWQLDENRMKLLSGSILAAADVLADAALDRGDRARKLLAKYRSILDRYQQSSSSALAVQITTLAQTASPAGRLEAVNLALKLLDEKQVPVDQKAAAVIHVLETIHQALLEKQANLSAAPDDLARANFNLARKGTILREDKSLPATLADRLGGLYVVTAVDAGRFAEARQSLTASKTLENADFADLDLARAKLTFAEKDYLNSAAQSMTFLQKISPGDIRYWHALIVNLQAHLALASDRDQIASAILARRQEYPELGNSATRAELETILNSVQPQAKEAK